MKIQSKINLRLSFLLYSLACSFRRITAVSCPGFFICRFRFCCFHICFHNCCCSCQAGKPSFRIYINRHIHILKRLFQNLNHPVCLLFDFIITLLQHFLCGGKISSRHCSRKQLCHRYAQSQLIQILLFQFLIIQEKIRGCTEKCNQRILADLYMVSFTNGLLSIYQKASFFCFLYHHRLLKTFLRLTALLIPVQKSWKIKLSLCGSIFRLFHHLLHQLCQLLCIHSRCLQIGSHRWRIFQTVPQAVIYFQSKNTIHQLWYSCHKHLISIIELEFCQIHMIIIQSHFCS